MQLISAFHLREAWLNAPRASCSIQHSKSNHLHPSWHNTGNVNVVPSQCCSINSLSTPTECTECYALMWCCVLAKLLQHLTLITFVLLFLRMSECYPCLFIRELDTDFKVHLSCWTSSYYDQSYYETIKSNYITTIKIMKVTEQKSKL